jgi:WhiB family redox-sensing transcriptional regulator
VSWQEQAACRGAATDLWFPDSGNTDHAAEAKRVCAGCPVRQDCLDANLGEKHGIYGGFSENDRRRERRRRRNMGKAA